MTINEKAAQARQRMLLRRSAIRLLKEMLLKSGITKVELASRMCVSKPRISKLLHGDDSNVTVKTLAHAASCMGFEIGMRAVPLTNEEKGI